MLKDTREKEQQELGKGKGNVAAEAQKEEIRNTRE